MTLARAGLTITYLLHVIVHIWQHWILDDNSFLSRRKLFKTSKTLIMFQQETSQLRLTYSALQLIRITWHPI